MLQMREGSPKAIPLEGGAEASLLRRRRTIFGCLVVSGVVGLIALAAVAVPPRGLAAVVFLALFALTLPWTVIGFCNAAIGFWIMRRHVDPAAAVNPLIA